MFLKSANHKELHKHYWTFISIYLIFYTTTTIGTANNYPSKKYNPKPCAALKPVIEYEAPICIPTKDGFEPQSVQNCEVHLKAKCPEFNLANCEWFKFSWDNKATISECNLQNIQFPTCKLRYKAGFKFFNRTWMEIFYVNQYGTTESNQSIFSIVELHRDRKLRECFRDLDQPQWPLSVKNANAAMGVDWKTIDFEIEKFTKEKLNQNQGPLCASGKDTNKVCSKQVQDLVVKYHNSTVIKTEEGFTLGEPVANCVWTILERGGDKQAVCQVTFRVNVNGYEYSKKVFQTQMRKQGLWARTYDRSVEIEADYKK